MPVRLTCVCVCGGGLLGYSSSRWQVFLGLKQPLAWSCQRANSHVASAPRYPLLTITISQHIKEEYKVILFKTLILSPALVCTVNLQGIKSQLQVNSK